MNVIANCQLKFFNELEKFFFSLQFIIWFSFLRMNKQNQLCLFVNHILIICKRKFWIFSIHLVWLAGLGGGINQLEKKIVKFVLLILLKRQRNIPTWAICYGSSNWAQHLLHYLMWLNWWRFDLHYIVRMNATLTKVQSQVGRVSWQRAMAEIWERFCH